ncbi:TadE/TadG family type IV pilus assembly protein [Acidiferrimicrobium sp. IK]|uniref:TadE/TadG family type IV pilus assembly protein n=1 Tax=Acidiferrimicrobium sp. IK TaxID=2871700 RepID=UPI0021CB709B|nr:TadE/TadG family type IV pilus assembly protein [Acidiferrimicrobium sp. IK]
MVFRSRRRREPNDVLPGPNRQEACHNRHIRGIPTSSSSARARRLRPRCRWRPARHRRARRFPRWGGESGAVAAELVIATPLLLLLILGVVQFALWEHATGIAEAAAQQGLSVARLQGETAQAGTAETRTILDQLGTGVLVAPQVTAIRTGVTTTVVVSGHAESVVGMFTLPVRATAVGPTEPPATVTAAGAGP